MNKESVVAIAIAAIVVAAAAGGALLFSLPNGNNNVEYSIEYNLDGGVNAEENPAKYKYGVGTELYDAYKTGYLFTGWYTDSSLTEKIDRISNSSSGNYKLTAGWAKSTVGDKVTYNIDGTVTETYFMTKTTTTITGSMELSYFAYSEGRGYMIKQVTDAQRKTGSSVTPVKSDETYWTEETDDKFSWYEKGTETLMTVYGEKLCNVYKGVNGTETETQYVGKDDSILYYALYESSSSTPYMSSSSTNIEYTLKTLAKVEAASEDVTVAAYNDIGISSTGSDVYKTGSNVTLVASTTSDKQFKGWYDEKNNLLSKSKTYHIDNVLIDCKVYALNTADPDIITDDKTVSISPDVQLTDVTWTFTDGTEKTVKADVLNYTFSESGEHKIDYTGKDTSGRTYYGTLQTINGAVKKSFEWTFEKTEYNYDLYITYNDYMSYVNNTTSRSQGTEKHDLEFVTYNDQYVKKLANDLNDIASNKKMSEIQKANFMLSFVQNIKYVSDSESKGVDEYWKFPVETLYEQNGDCEDTAILFCAMMKALGYNDALLIFSGHMASGLEVDGASGTYYEKNGVKYYYCETTSTGWKVGQIPDGYDSARVIPVV